MVRGAQWVAPYELALASPRRIRRYRSRATVGFLVKECSIATRLNQKDERSANPVPYRPSCYFASTFAICAIKSRHLHE